MSNEDALNRALNQLKQISEQLDEALIKHSILEQKHKKEIDESDAVIARLRIKQSSLISLL